MENTEYTPPVRHLVPPPEIQKILKENTYTAPIEWLSVPSDEIPIRRLSTKDLLDHGQVDLEMILQPFLGSVYFDQTVRTMDVLNGCGHQCPVCLADAALPGKIFSYESLDALFSNPKFIQMLQPDSLRFGSSGDILDHPAGVDIVQMALARTEILDAARMQKEGKHHQIKVFTNYRPNAEDAIDELVAMAVENPDRLRLTISMPSYPTDVVNKKFTSYVESRPDLFGNYEIDKEGLVHLSFGKTNMKNITVNDVRHHPLFMSGRVFEDMTPDKRIRDLEFMDRYRHVEFRDRGLVKLYLNPDGLWLNVYVTPVESNTNRLFTLITPQNLEVLAQVPFHYDFPQPPFWPGGKGERRNFSQVEEDVRHHAEHVEPTPLTVIRYGSSKS